MKKYLCWHFLQNNKQLRWGTKEIIEEGKTYTAIGKLQMCENGMHGSEEILDALDYAPGSVICFVEIWGEVKKDTDKLVGRNRKVLKMINGEKLLRKFARECALHAVKHYWHDAPDIVVRYLKTGDEKIRATAWAAAEAAARAAAWAAAEDAAKVAAWNAAGATAWANAWDTWDAARDAARGAARVAQNRSLRIMVKKEMGLLEGGK